MVWGSIGVVLLLAPLVRPSPVAAKAKCSAADCRRQCYDDWLEDTISCETDDVSDLIADRQTCNANVVCNSFPSCLGTCSANLSVPGNSGRCALARSCSRSCRTNRGRLQGVCFKEFNRRLRADCLTDSELRTAAQKARRECRRECRKPADRDCPPKFDPAEFPDFCSEAWTPDCQKQCVTGSDCQKQCVNGIVGSCNQKCAQTCGGDQDALLVCQRVCRNGQCQRLQSQCVSEAADDGSSAGGSQSYQACCLASGTACDEDTTESVACVSTTTSTTTTSTTTVTTTTVVGSTTTTTTVVGGTTTTSTTLINVM